MRGGENGFSAQPQGLFPVGDAVWPRAMVIIDWGECRPTDGQRLGKTGGGLPIFPGVACVKTSGFARCDYTASRLLATRFGRWSLRPTLYA